jgi:hypothetical protein
MAITRRIDEREVFKNHLLGLPGPRAIARTLSREDEIAAKIFRGFSEIVRSRECLNHVKFYLQLRPPTTNYERGRTKSSYLRYHIEKYFEEMYLLKERLISYLKVICKYYRSDLKTRSRLQRFSESIEKNLRNILDIRGRHVHIQRYSSEELDRLATLEFLIYGGKIKGPFSFLYKQIEYPQIKKQWTAKITRNNQIVKKLIDIYFDRLFPLVFNERQEIIIPRGINKEL